MKKSDPLPALFSDAGTLVENPNGTYHNVLLEKISGRLLKLSRYGPGKFSSVSN